MQGGQTLGRQKFACSLLTHAGLRMQSSCLWPPDDSTTVRFAIDINVSSSNLVFTEALCLRAVHGAHIEQGSTQEDIVLV